MLAQKYWEIATSLPEPVKKVIAAVAITASKLFRPTTFTFRGKEYPYFYHRYNLTWRNERAVEIPIAREILDRYTGKRVLEVGNMMSHYFPVDHDVVDKYEEGRNVINQDIVCYEPEERYDLILCISTLEHVGLDDGIPKPEKPLLAIRKLTEMLAPGGELFVSFILGYNQHLDELLAGGELRFTGLHALRRNRVRNIWREVAAESVLGQRCNTSGDAAVVFGLLRKERES